MSDAHATIPAASARAAVLADALLTTKALLGRYLAGFNDVTAVRQTPDLPNHLAWTLGHLALTMHRVSAMFDHSDLPASDFVAGDGTAGSRERGVFDRDAVAFASRPEERHDRYPTLARATEIYNRAVDRLAAAIRAANDSKLDELVQWTAGQQMPLWQLASRMIFHNGFHTGQIADLRRALGFRSVF